MIHELCRCRRCKAVPRHLDCVGRTDTGVTTAVTCCVKCGWLYAWRMAEEPTERAILCDERRIPPARLARLREMEGS